jgi:hypothetical protein
MEPQNTLNTRKNSAEGGTNLLTGRFVEMKAGKAIEDIHRSQCLNYLKASGLYLCLLLNFGKPRLEIKRFVLTQ